MVSSRICRALFTCLLAALLCAGASPVRAQDQGAEARAQFERGVTLADRGEIDAAIEAFEIAYRAQPHPAVLFNLGQAYSAGGRPVDAVRSLRSYLDLAAPQSPRKEQAEQLIRFNEARIGRLRLKVQPEHAELLVDGRVLGKARDLTSLELPAGAHVISARAKGYAEATRQVDIRPWADSDTSLSLSLEPRSEARTGFGTLEVVAKPTRARVKVDGVLHDGKPLSEGPHWVAVEYAGYEPFERRVDIEANRATRVDARLTPLGESLELEVARRRRTVAYVNLGLAVASGAVAITLQQVNHARYQRWNERKDEDEAEVVIDHAVDVQRMDNAAVACAVVGGALLVSAVTLWFTSQKPASADTKGKPVATARAGLLSLRF